VDPVTDTPQRLKEWSEKFKAGPGWMLVTGPRHDVEKLLKALHVFTADKWSHSPIVLVGNDATGQWQRAYGLASPAKLAEIVTSMIAPAATNSSPPPVTDDSSSDATSQGQGTRDKGQGITEELSPAHKYFTDVTLVNQDGKQMRLYSDLIKGKIVVINAFFTSCQGSCPVMAATLAKIQDWLGDRLGKDVYLISVSVDPETDTPAKLKEYAERFKAKPGWYFLTGTKQNVNLALHKLGQYVENKEAHLNIMIVGNEPTGLWKKAFGLAKSEELIKVVDSALNDKGTGN
jgi:cytochrome oxidase Cu insertion factor (SCO1/SenC/PrrC family)